MPERRASEWTAPLIWKMLGIIIIFVTGMVTIIWSSVDEGRKANAAQDVHINRLQVTSDSVKDRLVRIEDKLDSTDKKLDEIIKILKK